MCISFPVKLIPWNRVDKSRNVCICSFGRLGQSALLPAISERYYVTVSRYHWHVEKCAYMSNETWQMRFIVDNDKAYTFY